MEITKKLVIIHLSPLYQPYQKYAKHLDHCTQQNLMDINQHCLTKGKSTPNAIIKLAEFIIYSIEEGGKKGWG